MDARSVAEDFFWLIVQCKKNMNEIPQSCSQGENGVLIYLGLVNNEISPSELSEKLNVSLPRIATVLTVLESKKLITKKVNENDKRKVIVAITDEGRKNVLERKEETIINLTKILENMTEEERSDYLRLSKRFIEIIQKL